MEQVAVGLELRHGCADDARRFFARLNAEQRQPYLDVEASIGVRQET